MKEFKMAVRLVKIVVEKFCIKSSGMDVEKFQNIWE